MKTLIIILLLICPTIVFCQSNSFRADTSIVDIFLLDNKSAELVLGENIELIQSDTAFPKVLYYNKDRTELLTLIFHPGNIKNEFSEFLVQTFKYEFSNDVTNLNEVENFLSGRGIKLGIDEKAVIEILGPVFEKSTQNDRVTITYKITDIQNSYFLKKYNMPLYYGKYIFEKNKLVEFKFGFEYP